MSVTREQKFLSDTERTCMSKNLDDTVRLHSKRRVDTRGAGRETTRGCRGHEHRCPSGKLISRVISRKKRVSGYLSVQITRSCEMGENQGERELHLGEKEGGQTEGGLH